MPVVAPILKEAGTTPVVLPWSAYGFEGYSNTLFASDKALAGKRDAVRRFVSVIKQAELLIKADPARAAADGKAIVPETDEAIVLGGINTCLNQCGCGHGRVFGDCSKAHCNANA